MTFWMGISSQIDGLGHMGENHMYYNGNSAEDLSRRPGNQVVHRQIAARCDSRRAGYKLMGDILPEGTAFNRKEIEAAAKAAIITIEAGDVVLFHTGWLNMDSTSKRFMAGSRAWASMARNTWRVSASQR